MTIKEINNYFGMVHFYKWDYDVSDWVSDICVHSVELPYLCPCYTDTEIYSIIFPINDLDIPLRVYLNNKKELI